MNSCSDVLIDLEYRAWLDDPEGYEAEQAAIRAQEYDMHDDPAFWEDEPEQATEQEGEDMTGNCGQCGGTGTITVDSGATPWATDFIMLDCPACDGSGEELQHWENFKMHRDDDDGAECILEAEYISGAAHVVVIRAGSEPLDINQIRQLRDWLNEVLDKYADEWNERLAAGFGGA